ncbi:MAG: 3-hydroxybutyryl-CoA dehydrogenase [Thermomicrobiales bacterium]
MSDNTGEQHDVQRIGVVGAGTMGAGIAQVMAHAGIAVTLVDQTDAFLAKGLSTITSGLDRLVAKGRIDATERDAVLARIATSTATSDLAGVDLAIEVVPERFEIKRDVVRGIADAVGQDAIIASNTSSISITALAALVERPERVIGMHFFNPVPVLALVEVIRGLQTDDETVARTMALATRIGKTPVEVADAPGFVANRLLLPMINEAVFALAEGVASAEDIDTVMKLGAAHPMGPLALADLIGLDVCLGIMDVLQTQFGDDKYRPAPLLRQMVAAGRLGRKSGRGFHDYTRKEGGSV